MVNVDKQIVAALTTIGLPVSYEMVINKSSTIPAITYYQLTNFVETKYVNDANISLIYYTITIWSHNVSDFDTYGESVDKVMRDLGFRRTAATQLRDNESTMMRLIMEYQGRSYELFNKQEI